MESVPSTESCCCYSLSITPSLRPVSVTGVTNAGCRFASPSCGFAPALENHERSVLVAVSPRGRGERSRPLAVQAFGCECFASRPPSVYLPRSSSRSFTLQHHWLSPWPISWGQYHSTHHLPDSSSVSGFVDPFICSRDRLAGEAGSTEIPESRSSSCISRNARLRLRRLGPVRCTHLLGIAFPLGLMLSISRSRDWE